MSKLIATCTYADGQVFEYVENAGTTAVYISPRVSEGCKRYTFWEREALADRTVFPQRTDNLVSVVISFREETPTNDPA